MRDFKSTADHLIAVHEDEVDIRLIEAQQKFEKQVTSIVKPLGFQQP
jgi:hypothetical protein